MIALLIASAFISFQDPVNPSQTITIGGYDMPDAPISRLGRIADRQFIADPLLQRGGYDFGDLENRYPTRTVVPVEQRRAIPLEEELANTQYENAQFDRQVNLQGELLRQNIANKELEYKDSVNQQVEKALPLLGKINPMSENYQLQVADFFEKNALAFKDQSFVQLFNNLDDTNKRWIASQEVKTQYAQRTDDQNNYADQREEAGLLREVAKFGEGALAEYNASLEEDAQNGQLGNPYKAFARASTVIAQKQRELAETKPITTSEFRSLVGLKAKILENDSIDELEPSQRAELEAIQGQINSYLAPRTSGGIPTQTKIAAPTSTPMPVPAPSSVRSGINPSQPSPQQPPQLQEGRIFTQNGVRFKVTNGQAVPIK